MEQNEKIKVVLLGDSIRQIGYGPLVPAKLGDGFEVSQPADNCRFAQYTLRMLFDKADIPASCDIVHFNCGAWDICDLFGDGPFTPEEEYKQTMLRIARLLQKYARRVIFATTVPPRDAHPYNRIETIRRYNELLVPEFQKMGIEINDLFSVIVGDREHLICDDLIHLSPEGSELCADKVCEKIRKAAECLK